MDVPLHHRRLRRSRLVAAAVVALAAAGCGSSTTGTSTAGTSPPTGPADGSSPALQPGDLEGTWRTPEIPLEQARAAYQRAGGSPAEAEEFVAQLGGGAVRRTVAFEFRVDEQSWDQYEYDDGGAAVLGWSGTYTVDGAVVHAHEVDYGCAIDYAPTLSGDQLTLQVLRDEGDEPMCGREDLLAQRTIYETAPFTRVP